MKKNEKFDYQGEKMTKRRKEKRCRKKKSWERKGEGGKMGIGKQKVCRKCERCGKVETWGNRTMCSVYGFSGNKWIFRGGWGRKMIIHNVKYLLLFSTPLTFQLSWYQSLIENLKMRIWTRCEGVMQL